MTVTAEASVPVLVVGAGPTGITAATLLAQYGIRCLVLDRWSERVSAAPGGAPRRRSPPHHRPSGHRRRIRGDLPAGAGTAAARPRFAPAGRVSTAMPARSRHGFPQANMFDQPELEALLREQPASSTRTRNCAATSRSPTSAEMDQDRSTSRSPIASTGERHQRRSRLRARAATAPTAWCAIVDRRRDARPAVRAALAGRRRRHRRPTRPVGRRAPGLRPGPRRDLHADRASPATAGSSGCCPAKPPTTTPTLDALRPLIAPWIGGVHRRRPDMRARRRVHLPRPVRRPVAPRATSSCSATPPT